MRPVRRIRKDAALRTAASSLLLLLVAALPARGQGLSSGVIEGALRDQDGRALGNVVITLTQRATGRTEYLQSRRTGSYTSGLLTPGSYDALFERIGYIPERIEGVDVGAGDRVELDVTLTAASGAVETVNVRSASDVTPRPSISTGGWLLGRDAAALPLAADELPALAALSSRSGPELEIEGLPADLTTVVIDGVPSARRVSTMGTRARNRSVPLTALSAGGLVIESPDVEWPGTGAGYLTAVTHRGPGELRFTGFGDYSGDSFGAPADVAPFTAYHAGGSFGGPIVQDTAHFVVGAEAAQAEIPLQSLYVPGAGVSALAAAAAQAGYPVNAYTDPHTYVLKRASGFVQVDARLGRDNRLRIGGNLATMPDLDVIDPRTGRVPPPGTQRNAREVMASATLATQLNETTSNEATLGFELGRLKSEADPGVALAPVTTVSDPGVAFGSDGRALSTSDLLHLYLRETIYLDRGDHHLKFGASGSFPMYEFDLVRGTAGAFTFPGVNDFVQGRGAFRRLDGTATRADFSLRQYTFYGQDQWTPMPGLEILTGVRVGLTRFPDSADIRFNPEWYRLTTIRNTQIPDQALDVEPRFAITYAPSGRPWRVFGSVQVTGGALDPALIGEVFANDGALVAFQGVGDLGVWPAMPDTFAAPSSGPTLTLLGPDFRGPRTSHASVGLSTRIPGIANLSAIASFRRTEFLPRRRDVNLLPLPVARDQNGRPIFGTLIKQGGLLVAENHSNRRLIEFDHVWSLESTGTSTYSGVTFSLERGLPGPVGVFASYTFSRTTDDWLLGDGYDPATRLAPFPDTLNSSEWPDGRSDLDVPHRFVAGLQLRVPGRYGPTLAGIFRFQSGYPFTPGFRDGVDINGDGSGRNDPAFIDSSIAGTDALISRWPCLATDAGGYTERNACRGPDRKSLDLRLGVHVFDSARYSAEIVVDALNLIGSDYGQVDRALYLVDPASSLGFDATSNQVTVPLVANEHFGELLTRYEPQRVLRLGLRLRY